MEYLLNKYKNFVRIKAKSYFLIGADREDIIQEGMIGLYKAVRDFKADKLSSFRAFAELCITRQIITAIKTATRQKHIPLNQYISLNKPIYDEDSERTLLDVMASQKTSDPEELVVTQEVSDDIRQRIRQNLSELESQVLESYLEGKSYQEMARDLGPSREVDRQRPAARQAKDREEPRRVRVPVNSARHPRMPLHIGIVACSAPGAALCYRTICAEGATLLGPHAHPDVSMHSPSFARYAGPLEREDWLGVADLMLDSANRLASVGCDFLICPDNTIHQALPAVEPRSPLPWLHIAQVVADEAARRGFRRLGLTGTRWFVDSDVYPDRLMPRGIECVRPTPGERDEIHRIIMDELVYGDFRAESVAYLQRVIERMKSGGCDAVVLGCTEIPLVIDDANSPLPTLDSTRLLARAALNRAVTASAPTQRV